MANKPRMKLKEARLYWAGGEIRRNGKHVPDHKVNFALKAKYERLHGKEEDYIPLTDDDVEQIMNEDPSRYLMKPPPDVLMKEKIKRLEVESKLMDYRLKKEEFRQQNAGLSETKVKSENLLKKLMNECGPDDFNLQVYQRMPLHLCVLAIQSIHKDLSEGQCKRLIGHWVVKGY